MMWAGPARGARDGEDGREEVRGNAQAVVDRGGVEIDVGVELFLPLHDFGDLLAHLDPLGLASSRVSATAMALRCGCARVDHLVDRVAHAHDLFLFRELVRDPGVDLVRAADFLEHVNDRLVRAPVQRALQRPDGPS